MRADFSPMQASSAFFHDRKGEILFHRAEFSEKASAMKQRAALRLCRSAWKAESNPEQKPPFFSLEKVQRAFLREFGKFATFS